MSAVFLSPLARPLIIAGIVSILWGGRLVAADPLAELIEELRDQEALYETLDVVVRETYDIGDRKPPKGSGAAEGSIGGSMGGVVVRQDIHRRYVVQNERFRLEMGNKSKVNDGENADTNYRAAVFDGVTTRMLEGNGHAFVTAGRVEHSEAFRPHMLLMSPVYNQAKVPLSVYLEGDAAMKRFSRFSNRDGYVITGSDRGEAEFRGLKCRRVTVTVSIRGQPYNSWEFWLAVDRNYIPARKLSYTFRFSKTEPVGESVVDEWKELRPGVWFPMSATVTAFNQFEIQRTGKRRLQWRHRYHVEEVRLGERKPDEFFKLPFPAGTKVTERDADGQKVRQYRVQADEP